ncbi:MAG: hypothetical protein PHS81_04055 [Candidatus Nanoarchaeia archaeon]|nr:hypothetical protein [Candidatus Nanoarchaeia archaeon]
MKKSQELSLNLIVVGALALLVFLIVGGILIFSGGDILGSLEGMGASQEEVSITTFRSGCSSKCRVLQQLSPSVSGTINQDEMLQIKAFCCENYDLNSNGVIELSTSLGPEVCSLAYPDCRVSGRLSLQLCKGVYLKEVINPVFINQVDYFETYFDFTKVDRNQFIEIGFQILPLETCELN